MAGSQACVLLVFCAIMAPVSLMIFMVRISRPVRTGTVCFFADDVALPVSFRHDLQFGLQLEQLSESARPTLRPSHTIGRDGLPQPVGEQTAPPCKSRMKFLSPLREEKSEKGILLLEASKKNGTMFH